MQEYRMRQGHKVYTLIKYIVYIVYLINGIYYVKYLFWPFATFINKIITFIYLKEFGNAYFLFEIFIAILNLFFHLFYFEKVGRGQRYPFFKLVTVL